MGGEGKNVSRTSSVMHSVVDARPTHTTSEFVVLTMAATKRLEQGKIQFPDICAKSIHMTTAAKLIQWRKSPSTENGPGVDSRAHASPSGP